MLTLPPGPNGSPQNARAAAVSCTSPGTCVAGGQYLDGHALQQAFVAVQAGGAWGAASELTLPSNVAGGAAASLASISCSTPGSCIAVGHYQDIAGEQQPFVVSATGGSWGQAVELAEPANAEPSGSQFADLGALSCTAAAACLAGGRFTDANGHIQPMIESSVPTLSLNTASLPDGVQGAPYSVQLGASGGAGSYAWSVSSGVLPPGLSLNAVNGLISGTPTVVGDTTFAVTLRDPGPPAQQATQTLSVQVVPPPATQTTIEAAAIKPHKHTASFSFAANGTVAASNVHSWRSPSRTAVSTAVAPAR